MQCMNRWTRLSAMVTVVAISMMTAQGYAGVSAEEAKQLGGPLLTVFGSERAGNQEGTIPEYTGKGAKLPSAWDPKNPKRRPDPYGEKPLFTITAQNAAQYADKLDGMIEMFKRYPDFRMNIYPTHRDSVAPQYVIDNTRKNATACQTIDNELTLKGCYGGLPFPLPKTANQVMWNHLVSYHSWSVKGDAEVWVVPPTGAPSMVDRVDWINNWPYYDPANNGPLADDQLYFRYLGKDLAPARLVGGQFLLLDAVDQLKIGRRAYLYTTGKRWVKLAANLAYDTPTPYGGGIATMDDARSFFGALDRFEFELVGKKEKFIYYDNYEIMDPNICSAEKYHATKGFPNPDCVRYELHRVWEVRAKRRAGVSHLYSKRVLFWDEDGYVAGMGENYDDKGKLIRITNNLMVPFYESTGVSGGSNIHMDLVSGTWVTSGYMACPNCGCWPMTSPLPKQTFDPDAMAGSGIR